MSLTKQQRDALKDSDFAVPGKRKLPIHDEKHVRMAWDMVSKTKDLTDEERSAARAHILSRAKTLGIDTEDWNLKASLDFEAMSLEVPETEGHPNKLPFSGVLTKVDELSDAPPGGADGKRVMITRVAAEAAIPSILGMAVDFKETADGHAPQNKVGVITEAYIEANDFKIKGFLWAADFPDECDYIQEHRDELGFSYEVKRARIASLDAAHLTVESLYFTGAAILNKKDAAYKTTSLSAKADAEIDMTKDELNALLKPITDQLSTLSASVEALSKKPEKDINAASVAHIVNPHSAAIRAAADGMEKAGLGVHEKRGHVAHLRAMADCMDAEAVTGKLPHMYDSGNQYYAGAEKDLKAAAEAAKAERAQELKPIQDALAGLTTQLKDLEAKAFAKAENPERKTVSPGLTALLAKGGITLDAAAGEKKLDASAVDAALQKAGISDVSRRMAFKTELREQGLIA